MFNGYNEAPLAYNNSEPDRGKKHQNVGKWSYGPGTGMHQPSHSHNHQPDFWPAKPFIGIPKCCTECYTSTENHALHCDSSRQRAWFSRTFPAVPLSSESTKHTGYNHWDGTNVATDRACTESSVITPQYAQEGEEKTAFYRPYVNTRPPEAHHPGVITSVPKNSDLIRKDDMGKHLEEVSGTSGGQDILLSRHNSVRQSVTYDNHVYNPSRERPKEMDSHYSSNYCDQSERYPNVDPFRLENTSSYPLDQNIARHPIEPYVKTVPLNPTQNRVPLGGNRNIKETVPQTYIDQNANDGGGGKLICPTVGQHTNDAKSSCRSVFQTPTKETGSASEIIQNGQLNQMPTDLKYGATVHVDYPDSAGSRDFSISCNSSTGTDSQKMQQQLSKNAEYYARNSYCDQLKKSNPNYLLDAKKDYMVNQNHSLSIAEQFYGNACRTPQVPSKYWEAGNGKISSCGIFYPKDFNSSDSMNKANSSREAVHDPFHRSDPVMKKDSSSFSAPTTLPRSTIYPTDSNTSHHSFPYHANSHYNRHTEYPYQRYNPQSHFEYPHASLPRSEIPAVVSQFNTRSYHPAQPFPGGDQYGSQVAGGYMFESQRQPSNLPGKPFQPQFYSTNGHSMPLVRVPHPVQQHYPTENNSNREADALAHRKLESIRSEEVLRNGNSKISPLRLLRKKKFLPPVPETVANISSSNANSDAAPALDVRKFWATWADEEEDNVTATEMVVLDCQNIDQAELLRLYESDPIRTVQLGAGNIVTIKDTIPEKFTNETPVECAASIIEVKNNYHNERLPVEPKNNFQSNPLSAFSSVIHSEASQKPEKSNLYHHYKTLPKNPVSERAVTNSFVRNSSEPVREAPSQSMGLPLIVDATIATDARSSVEALQKISMLEAQFPGEVKDREKKFELPKKAEKSKAVEMSTKSEESRINSVPTFPNSISCLPVDRHTTNTIRESKENIKPKEDVRPGTGSNSAVQCSVVVENKATNMVNEKENQKIEESEENSGDDSTTEDMPTLSELPTSEYRKNKFLDFAEANVLLNMALTAKKTEELKKEKEMEKKPEVKEVIFENKESLEKERKVMAPTEACTDQKSTVEDKEQVCKDSKTKTKTKNACSPPGEVLDELLKKISEISICSPNSDSKVEEPSQKTKKPKKVAKKCKKLPHGEPGKKARPLSLENSCVADPSNKFSIQKSQGLKMSFKVLNSFKKHDKPDGCECVDVSKNRTDDHYDCDNNSELKSDRDPMKIKSVQNESSACAEDDVPRKKHGVSSRKNRPRSDNTPEVPPKTPVLKIKKIRYLGNEEFGHRTFNQTEESEQNVTKKSRARDAESSDDFQVLETVDSAKIKLTFKRHKNGDGKKKQESCIFRPEEVEKERLNSVKRKKRSKNSDGIKTIDLENLIPTTVAEFACVQEEEQCFVSALESPEVEDPLGSCEGSAEGSAKEDEFIALGDVKGVPYLLDYSHQQDDPSTVCSNSVPSFNNDAQTDESPKDSLKDAEVVKDNYPYCDVQCCNTLPVNEEEKIIAPNENDNKTKDSYNLDNFVVDACYRRNSESKDEKPGEEVSGSEKERSEEEKEGEEVENTKKIDLTEAISDEEMVSSPRRNEPNGSACAMDLLEEMNENESSQKLELKNIEKETRPDSPVTENACEEELSKELEEKLTSLFQKNDEAVEPETDNAPAENLTNEKQKDDSGIFSDSEVDSEEKIQEAESVIRLLTSEERLEESESVEKAEIGELVEEAPDYRSVESQLEDIFHESSDESHKDFNENPLTEILYECPDVKQSEKAEAEPGHDCQLTNELSLELETIDALEEGCVETGRNAEEEKKEENDSSECDSSQLDTGQGPVICEEPESQEENKPEVVNEVDMIEEMEETISSPKGVEVSQEINPDEVTTATSKDELQPSSEELDILDNRNDLSASCATSHKSDEFSGTKEILSDPLPDLEEVGETRGESLESGEFSSGDYKVPDKLITEDEIMADLSDEKFEPETVPKIENSKRISESQVSELKKILMSKSTCQRLRSLSPKSDVIRPCFEKSKSVPRKMTFRFNERTAAVISDIPVSEIPLPPGDTPKENCFDFVDYFRRIEKDKTVAKTSEGGENSDAHVETGGKFKSLARGERTASPVAREDSPKLSNRQCISPFIFSGFRKFRNPSPPFVEENRSEKGSDKLKHPRVGVLKKGTDSRNPSPPSSESGSASPKSTEARGEKRQSGDVKKSNQSPLLKSDPPASISTTVTKPEKLTRRKFSRWSSIEPLKEGGETKTHQVAESEKKHSPVKDDSKKEEAKESSEKIEESEKCENLTVTEVINVLEGHEDVAKDMEESLPLLLMPPETILSKDDEIYTIQEESLCEENETKNSPEIVGVTDDMLDFEDGIFITDELNSTESCVVDEVSEALPEALVDGIEVEKVSDDDKFRNVMQSCLENAKKFLSVGNLKLFSCSVEDLFDIQPSVSEQSTAVSQESANHFSRDVLLTSCDEPASDELVLSESGQQEELSVDFVPSFGSDSSNNLCPEILPVDNWPYLEEEVPSSPAKSKSEDSVPMNDVTENPVCLFDPLRNLPDSQNIIPSYLSDKTFFYQNSSTSGNDGSAKTTRTRTRKASTSQEPSNKSKNRRKSLIIERNSDRVFSGIPMKRRKTIDGVTGNVITRRKVFEGDECEEVSESIKKSVKNLRENIENIIGGDKDISCRLSLERLAEDKDSTFISVTQKISNGGSGSRPKSNSEDTDCGKRQTDCGETYMTKVDSISAKTRRVSKDSGNGGSDSGVSKCRKSSEDSDLLSPVDVTQSVTQCEEPPKKGYPLDGGYMSPGWQPKVILFRISESKLDSSKKEESKIENKSKRLSLKPVVDSGKKENADVPAVNQAEGPVKKMYVKANHSEEKPKLKDDFVLKIDRQKLNLNLTDVPVKKEASKKVADSSTLVRSCHGISTKSKSPVENSKTINVETISKKSDVNTPEADRSVEIINVPEARKRKRPRFRNLHTKKKRVPELTNFAKEKQLTAQSNNLSTIPNLVDTDSDEESEGEIPTAFTVYNEEEANRKKNNYRTVESKQKDSSANLKPNDSSSVRVAENNKERKCQDHASRKCESVGKQNNKLETRPEVSKNEVVSKRSSSKHHHESRPDAKRSSEEKLKNKTSSQSEEKKHESEKVKSHKELKEKEKSRKSQEDKVKKDAGKKHEVMKKETIRNDIKVGNDKHLKDNERRESRKDESGIQQGKVKEKSVDETKKKQQRKDSATEDPRWVCDVCGFNDAQKRTAHIKCHSFHCQSCHLAFKTESLFISHLTKKHKNIKNQHHCLLCELSFDNEGDYQEHLTSREHRHLESVEKNTINTLFTLLTGQSCPVLGPFEVKPEWLPNEASTVHFYHQATPLSLALQYLKLRHETSSKSSSPRK